ncbi:inositol phosphorylceramide synthase [bacterium]|nr:inositol phosphorylceramide synthase [bacterium]
MANRWQKTKQFILHLRFEEFLAGTFFFLSAAVTIRAHLYFADRGHVPKYIRGDLLRIIAVVGLIAAYILFRKWNRSGKIYRFIREAAPFALAIAIYTNLHDTIHFVNPHDIHWTLIEIEGWIFGCQPVLWAQKFYNPILTEFFSFAYMNYFIIPIVIPFYLYFKGDYRDYRETIFGIVLTYYFGYILYVLFPAAPPRLVLADQFTRDFTGFFFASAQHNIIIDAASSRAAFPSLHCATTLLSMIYAFKYTKILRWAFLPIAIGLVLGTVYLRHHYVVDIIAGFMLAIFVYFVAPKIDRWWCKMRIEAGTEDESCEKIEA